MRFEKRSGIVCCIETETDLTWSWNANLVANERYRCFSPESAIALRDQLNELLPSGTITDGSYIPATGAGVIAAGGAGYPTQGGGGAGVAIDQLSIWGAVHPGYGGGNSAYGGYYAEGRVMSRSEYIAWISTPPKEVPYAQDCADRGIEPPRGVDRAPRRLIREKQPDHDDLVQTLNRKYPATRPMQALRGALERDTIAAQAKPADEALARGLAKHWGY